MRKPRRLLAALIVAAGAVALVTATTVTARPAKQAAAFKVAWIYPGPHNDGGWSQAHEAGRLLVKSSATHRCRRSSRGSSATATR